MASQSAISMSVQLLLLCVLRLFVPAADEFGYSINIKLTLVWAEFLLVPCVDLGSTYVFYMHLPC